MLISLKHVVDYANFKNCVLVLTQMIKFENFYTFCFCFAIIDDFIFANLQTLWYVKIKS
jgi:hypothetical protein